MPEGNRRHYQNNERKFAPEETFVNVTEAARELKDKGIGTFFEANQFIDPTFGIEGEESGKLYIACFPDKNFSRTQKFFLPKPIHTLATAANDFYSLHGGESNTYVFHYPINKNRFIKSMNKFEETDRFLRDIMEQNAKNNPSIDINLSNQQEPFNAQQFVTDFYERFDNPSCIYTSIFGGSIFIGEQTMLQRVTNFLKSAPHNSHELMRELGIKSSYIDSELERMSQIHIYDLAGKKKDEVHASLA